MPILLILIAAHSYVGWRLWPALAAWPFAQWVLLAALLASVILMPLGFMARRMRALKMSRSSADALAWAGALSMGWFSSTWVLTVLRELVLLAATAAHAVGATALNLAVISEWSGAAVLVLSAAVTLLGLWNARRSAAVVAVDVPIANLPAALQGFRIAQISDVHVGPTIKHGYVSAIVRSVNRLQADMVAVTGDLVDGSVADLAKHVAPLADLSSTHGTYFVTGNHEYYSGAHAWITELRRLGLTVLMNQHVVLQHGAAELLVAGVADHGAHHFDAQHRSDPQAALIGAPSQATVRVLLAHQPRSADAAEKAGFDLQLSGHTHGGQFWPWNHFVRLQQPFTAGLHKWKQLWVYTSRGTGYWGPPKRLGAPSEITHLRLVRAA
jgi:uncharacterized protein